MRPSPFSVSRRAARAAYTLTQLMIALAVFSVGTMMVWGCVDAVLFLSSKNTALNLSHATLQRSVDRLANQLRESLQVLDVANFDGGTFTHIDEGAASNAEGSVAGNAVRYIRALPGSYFMLPDNGTSYTQTNPQDPRSPLYPDYLSAGNRTVRATFTAPIPSLDTRDLAHARLFPRFPYLSENVTTGPSQGAKPGLGLSNVPGLSSGTVSFALSTGLPATSRTVPSCNQAFLVVESAAVLLNRGTYSELILYPDAADLTRSISLSTSMGASTAGSGPTAFSLLKSAGSLSDATARGSLRISLPVRSRDLDNAVARHGGAAALTNVALTVPVEVRRRAQF